MATEEGKKKGRYDRTGPEGWGKKQRVNCPAENLRKLFVRTEHVRGKGGGEGENETKRRRGV